MAHQGAVRNHSTLTLRKRKATQVRFNLIEEEERIVSTNKSMLFLFLLMLLRSRDRIQCFNNKDSKMLPVSIIINNRDI